MSYTDLTYTVPAGATETITRAGVWVSCLEASAPFRLRVDNQNEHLFEAGLTREKAGGFSQLQIINPTGSQIEVRLGIGASDMRDARLTLTSSAQLSTRPQRPDVMTSGAPVAASNGATTLLAAAEPLRRELILIAPASAAAPVYIGGASGATAGQGLPLFPGQAMILETTAAIYCRNDTGGAVSVAVAELEWSV